MVISWSLTISSGFFSPADAVPQWSSNNKNGSLKNSKKKFFITFIAFNCVPPLRNAYLGKRRRKGFPSPLILEADIKTN
jgi:hypothetical protein